MAGVDNGTESAISSKGPLHRNDTHSEKVFE